MRVRTAASDPGKGRAWSTHSLLRSDGLPGPEQHKFVEPTLNIERK